MKAGLRSFLRQIESLFDAGAVGEQTDRQLLERFNGGDRAAAELAFTAMVKRHGPMVLRACRAILGDGPEAEDAFQATFLVLARKASGLWVGDSLGPWLLAVAGRTASGARAAESRRRARERTAAGRAALAVEDRAPDDRASILHEELGRLPEMYRAAVLLCDLEGLTQEQAARHLGWPDGTVRSRLARGRERLRQRLTRRGIAPAIVLAPTPSIDAATATALEPIVRAAVGIRWKGSAAGVPASVMALAKGAMRIMWWSKLRTAAAVALTGALLCGSGIVGYRAMGRQPGASSGREATKRDPADGKTPAAPSSDAESPELAALGKARMELARKIHDSAFQLFQAGEIGLVDYLAERKRYDDVVAEVTVKTEADRIRFLERRVATLKQIADRTQVLFRRGIVRRMECDIAELARLDAEYALMKARLMARPGAK